MKLRLIATCATFALCACDVDTGTINPVGRLSVDDSLRQACFVKGSPVSDDMILDALLYADSLMARGWSWAQTIRLLENNCTLSCQEQCATLNAGVCPIDARVECANFCGDCFGAIVDQVYGL